MSGIFGLINRTAPPDVRPDLASMQAAMNYWGPDGSSLWNHQGAGLGQHLFFDTPEARYESLPRWLPDAQVAFTAAARIDNRIELCDLFKIPNSERSITPDSELILQAYLKWGEECPNQLLGDWSFAVWHPQERRLFLARDHHGNTAIYYTINQEQIAFASSSKALLALEVPRRIDELYLAQVLISWPAYHGERTIYQDIFRLPPAHAMSVTPDETKVWQYWRLEDTPDLHLPTFDAYVESFLDLYREAVHCRLRSLHPVGTTLSGGLDSGSVTAIAARQLGEKGKRLQAFCAIPKYETEAFIPSQYRFGDEGEYAQATAAYAGNVDLLFLTVETMSPMQGVARALEIFDEPQHAVNNQFWLLDLLDQAKARGIGTLLTGQGGNATISWTGADQSLGWKKQIQRSGLTNFVKQQVNRSAPDFVKDVAIPRRIGKLVDQRASMLNPAFIDRIGLHEAIQHDTIHPCILKAPITPREQRYRIIKPGHSLIGDRWMQASAAAQMSIRDPTLDMRVLKFCIAVPDHLFWGPTESDDRWLMRTGMKGYLPDSVRLNRRRGRQAADLLGLLRKEGNVVENVLAQFARSKCADYLDVARLQTIWERAKQDDSMKSFNLISTALMRSLMAGLFIDPSIDLT